MSINTNGKLLAQATRDLLSKWAHTQESWQDQKSREFEEQFLAALSASANRVAPVFDELDKLIAKVRNDCE